MTLNASITGITTRSPIIFWLLERIVKLTGGKLKIWRSRKRKERMLQWESPNEK